MAAKATEADPVQAQCEWTAICQPKQPDSSAEALTSHPQPSPAEDKQTNGTTDPVEDEGNDSDASATNDPNAEGSQDATPAEPTASSANGGSHVDAGSNGSMADSNAANRLAAAAKERDDLRVQVTELRKELEGIQQKHEDDISQTRKQLEETQTGKEHAENRYNKLLGQVNTIKTQLGERLKADAAELSQCREQIESLEEEGKAAKEDRSALQTQISTLETEKEAQTKEISSLRGRTNLSQQNWAKERDDMVQREAQVREEYEAAKQAMQDWEVLAIEERSLREGLNDRVAELEDQLSTQQEAHSRAVSERDDQSVTVDGLQRALQEVHEARKQERRELVENSEKQIEDLRKALKTAEQSSSEAQEALATARQELERTLPFEKEAKDKNLLIGKLRHEAVILNDHLTKALRFLKKGKPEDNVDRQLVSNHFIQFLALDRSDPKKFQILQLIAALLGWTDEQKESAGLARPGASTSSNLRVPLSTPFRRVSSTASLNPLSTSGGLTSPSLRSPSMSGPNFGSLDSPVGKESLAELWSDFLEREAEQGSSGGTPKQSRRSSYVGSAPPGGGRAGMMSPPMAGSPIGRKEREIPIAEEDISK
ncbi:hypothetical protein FH972_025592 [Carpinus fangiana]|uniref:GRIP domain-containing protein n=1 Tax=Carpinus fangiana TaxID=176857 RepID=A0A5N6L1V0_9ROSI|nr:hypothetical protein FH972_025592 [Carpinus fangiana]